MSRARVRSIVPAILLPIASAAFVGPVSAQTAEDLARGRLVYIGQCSRCHGVDGGGGEGPRLATSRLRHATTPEELANVIVGGIPGTAMRQTWQMSEQDLRKVVAYVWRLGHTVPDTRAPHGDPDAGRNLYRTLACMSCHVVDGVGGTLGPGLTDIGARRGLAHLRDSLVDPGASLPENPDPSGMAGSRYLPVDIETKAGGLVRGQRVAEDTFTIQVRDAEDGFYSFRKDDVASLRHDFGSSLMPSYRDRLSDDQLDDLVAYLAGLRGER